MSADRKNTTRRNRAAQQDDARAMQSAQEGAANAIDAIPDALNAQNVLRVLNGVRFTHELEKMSEAGEHWQATYMLFLRIRTGFMDVRIPLAGPLIESHAEQQRIIRSNQMSDAIEAWMHYQAEQEEKAKGQGQ